MKQVQLLASYPKSGNTWVRILLSALLSGENYDFNKLELRRIFNEAAPFRRHLEFDPFLLTQRELDVYYPKVWLAESDMMLHPILKTHETFRYNALEEPICGQELTQKVVYIIRDPLDVCISLSHFINISIDEAIDLMNTPGADSKAKFYQSATQLTSHFGSWQENVNSWTQQRSFPCLVVRYEDLLADTAVEFDKIATFLELPHTPEKLDYAIRKAAFGELQKNEQKMGFDRPPVSHAFFRKGMAGEWKNVLSAQQVDRIVTANGNTMKNFNYIQ